MHMQGIECQFVEEWHQKLHTNTTPEDISICEAYIGCLQSGNPDDFWRLLWENNGISREQLANMDRPVTGMSKFGGGGGWNPFSNNSFWQELKCLLWGCWAGAHICPVWGGCSSCSTADGLPTNNSILVGNVFYLHFVRCSLFTKL